MELPSPPRLEVDRDYAGGFGTATTVDRAEYGHGPFTMPNVSLLYSAGVLERSGHTIDFIDGQAERLGLGALIARIQAASPKVVLTVVNLPSLQGDLGLLSAIRASTLARVVVMGPTATQLTDAIFNGNAVDVAILGEPELMTPTVVQALEEGRSLDPIPGLAYRSDGGIAHTTPRTEGSHFASLPPPPFHRMPMTRYRDPHFGKHRRFFPIWGSRGCSMPCAFYCPYPWSYGREIIARSPSEVADELKTLVTKFGTRNFVFRDQIFSYDQGRAEELCDRIIELRLRVHWLCETRVDTVTDALLRKMKRAGCVRIHYGLETGDEQLFKKLGKPGTDLSRAKQALRLTREAGIKAHAHLLIGLPGETWKTVENTRHTIHDFGLTSMYYNVLTPYPGTPLQKLAVAKRWVEDPEPSRLTSFNSVMRNETMTVEDMMAAKDYLSRSHWETKWKNVYHILRNGDFAKWLKGRLDL